MNDNYYDSISEGYEELHKEEQMKKIKLIKQHIKINKDDKLLDVGCGTGLTTKPWKCHAAGLDPAKKLLEKAGEGKWVQGVAENIPFKDHEFDVVISITAIQNFTDIEKALKEIKRVGKDKFVLTFLKRSPKRKNIEKKIKEFFDVKEVIEEEKDMIFIIGF